MLMMYSKKNLHGTTLKGQDTKASKLFDFPGITHLGCFAGFPVHE